MDQFKFKDGVFEFWRVEFITPRNPLILRVPEGQAPMVKLEQLRRDTDEKFFAGKSKTRLEDPWERIVPLTAEDSEVEQWLAVGGEQFGYEGLVGELISNKGLKVVE